MGSGMMTLPEEKEELIIERTPLGARTLNTS
jgi:hypothetical protein